jgi:hypothetical protein
LTDRSAHRRQPGRATTPDTYPLTLNAIVLACNQKTARDPFLQLEPGEVGHALRQLESRGWVKSQHAARADRYAHRVEAKLDLSRAHTALLALLMLRGPQTASELLSRSERLAKFDTVGDCGALERCRNATRPWCGCCRQGSQRETAAHLLSDGPCGPRGGDRRLVIVIGHRARTRRGTGATARPGVAWTPPASRAPSTREAAHEHFRHCPAPAQRTLRRTAPAAGRRRRPCNPGGSGRRQRNSAAPSAPTPGRAC